MALLNAVDIWLLHFLNVDLGFPVMDHFWKTLTHLDRERWFTCGVLAPLMAAGLYIYRANLFKLLIALTIAIGVADSFSYRIVKPIVMRPRPSSNAEITSWLRPIGDAHGMSFPSNHTANCFAGAVILAWYFRRRAYFFYTIAGLIGASRVALGVHYPSDVIGGMLIGLAVGNLITTWLLKRRPEFWRLSMNRDGRRRTMIT